MKKLIVLALCLSLMGCAVGTFQCPRGYDYYYYKSPDPKPSRCPAGETMEIISNKYDFAGNYIIYGEACVRHSPGMATPTYTYIKACLGPKRGSIPEYTK